VFYASSFPSEAKLAGFAASAEAIAMASAKPDFSATEGNLMLSESVTLDKLGLTIFYNVWGDPASRNIIGSFELDVRREQGHHRRHRSPRSTTPNRG